MKICITGSIGSGKSSVLSILREFTPNCFSSDEINDELLNKDSYIKTLQENFGDNIVVDGVIDRKALAHIIFNDKEKRALLNSLSHPIIKERIGELIKNLNGNIFIEIPLLIESGLANFFDKIWLVDCDFDVRLTRIVKRDNLSLDSALAMINAQVKNEDELKNVATDTIYNNGDILELRTQVQNLIQELHG